MSKFIRANSLMSEIDEALWGRVPQMGVDEFVKWSQDKEGLKQWLTDNIRLVIQKEGRSVQYPGFHDFNLPFSTHEDGKPKYSRFDINHVFDAISLWLGARIQAFSGKDKLDKNYLDVYHEVRPKVSFYASHMLDYSMTMNQFIDHIATTLSEDLPRLMLSKVKGRDLWAEMKPQVEEYVDSLNLGAQSFSNIEHVEKFVYNHPDIAQKLSLHDLLRFSNTYYSNASASTKDVEEAKYFQDTLPNFYSEMNPKENHSRLDVYKNTDQLRERVSTEGPVFAQFIDRVMVTAKSLMSFHDTHMFERIYRRVLNIPSEEIEAKLDQLGSFEHLVLWLADSRFEQLSEGQKREIEEILKSGLDWHVESYHTTFVSWLINAAMRFPNVKDFTQFLNEEGAKHPVNVHNQTKHHKHSYTESLLQQLPAPHLNATQVYHMFNNKSETEAGFETTPLTQEQQAELLEYMRGLSPVAKVIINQNYQNAEKLHNLVERIYRAKNGTPEHHRIMKMILMMPSLVGVNPSAFEELVDISRQFANKKAGEASDMFHTHHLQSITHSEDHPEAMIDPSESQHELLNCAGKVLSWFKNDWRAALTIYASATGVDGFVNALHQFGNILPLYAPRTSPKGLKEYFWRFSRSGAWDNLIEVVKRWNDVDPSQVNLPPAKLLPHLMKRDESFKELEHLDERLLDEAAKWHDGESDGSYYAEVHEAYSRGQSVPLPSWTKDIVIVESGPKGKLYTGRFLSRDDPRGLFLGEYTNCCQHPRGEGAACAYHGQCSPYGAFFVITDESDNILTQSWVWEGADGNSVTFDNIESRGIQGREETVVKIYERAAEALGVDRVHIGAGYNKVNMSHLPSVRHESQDEEFYDPFEDYQDGGGLWTERKHPAPTGGKLLYPKDYDDYSDATSHQYVLKSNGIVNRLPSPESRIVIPNYYGDEDEEENEQPAVVSPKFYDPGWMLSNPYQSRSAQQEFARLVWSAKIADDNGEYEEADELHRQLIAMAAR